MLDLQAIPVPSSEFPVREVGDETVFLGDAGREVLSLNAMGSFIWQQMDGSRTVQDILDIICLEYDVDLERAEADLRTFVAELEAHKLLTLQTSDA